MTAVEHLGQALRLLEAEASEIEHRMSFVRSAIEAFGLDADSLLMDVIAEEEPFPWEKHHWADAPETVQQDDPEVPYGRTSAGRWDWDVIAQEIGKADAIGSRRTLWLIETFDVNASTAQWMVKRCREQGLIDIDRPTFTERNARDRAAAAL